MKEIIKISLLKDPNTTLFGNHWKSTPNAKGVIILVNKWDLIKEKDQHFTKEYEDKLREDLAPFKDVPILFTSTITKQRLHKALEKTIPCVKVGVSVIGLEVPHAHIHLIPINSIDDMNFNTEKLKLTSDEFNQMAKEIASNYNKLT